MLRRYTAAYDAEKEAEPKAKEASPTRPNTSHADVNVYLHQ